MSDRAQTQDLADVFADSFRALKPGRLDEAILALCRDVAREAGRERTPRAETETPQETTR